MALTSFPNGVKIDGFSSPTDATFTIGAEAGNAINVAIQLLDGAGDALTTSAAVIAYFSDNADGSTFSGTAPNGGVAIGTDGVAIPIVADDAFVLISEADGDIDLDVTDTGTPTYYLVVVLPSGRIVVSGAITFA